MADNYLEKRMEDYRRGSQSRRVSMRGSLKFPALQVFVARADSLAARAVVKLFVEAGCRVVFTLQNPKDGSAMAQQCGGRFYPMTEADALADVASRGEKIDVLVLAGDVDVAVPGGVKVISLGVECDGAVVISGENAENAAWMALAAARCALPEQVIKV